MTRRPRRNLPPRLPDHGPLFVEPPVDLESPAAPLTPRARLVAAGVAGRHPSMGRREVAHVVARLASAAPDACLGLELPSITRDEAFAALAQIWGWDATSARAVIDPERALAALDLAAQHIAAVASKGGRIALATGRPASLLPLYRAVGAHAVALGAELSSSHEHRLDGRRGHALWWIEGVAVVTDGAALLADDGVAAAEEWLFAVGRPDLVLADRGFAGIAAAAGHETVAFADVDAVALGVAARRGRPLCVVPLQDGHPPSAYEVALERLLALDPQGAPEPGGHHLAPGAHRSQSTT